MKKYGLLISFTVLSYIAFSYLGENMRLYDFWLILFSMLGPLLIYVLSFVRITKRKYNLDTLFFFLSNVNILLPKFIVVISNAIALILSLEWYKSVKDQESKYEPLIAIVTIGVSLLLQFKFWDFRNLYYFFIKKIQGYDDYFIPKLLSLSDSDFEISIHPINKLNYWRFGLKFSETFNNPLVRLPVVSPLFHLSQTNHKILEYNYYGDNGQLQENGIALKNPYDQEKLTILLEREIDNTRLKVVSDGTIIHTQTIPQQYLFCRIFCWADGSDFQFDCFIKRTLRASFL